MKVTAYIVKESGSVTAEWEVEGDISPYRPARTYGPPELCYPEESGELDVTRIELYSVKGIEGATLLDASLLDAELIPSDDEIEAVLYEAYDNYDPNEWHYI